MCRPNVDFQATLCPPPLFSLAFLQCCDSYDSRKGGELYSYHQRHLLQVTVEEWHCCHLCFYPLLSFRPHTRQNLCYEPTRPMSSVHNPVQNPIPGPSTPERLVWLSLGRLRQTQSSSFLEFAAVASFDSVVCVRTLCEWENLAVLVCQCCVPLY